MNELSIKSAEVEYLLTPEAIRDRARAIFDRTVSGDGHFIYHPDKLNETVEYVLKVIRANYPSLEIPFHSRWGHFKAEGVDRKLVLMKSLSACDRLERARTQLDLVITSVLLDAGAGNSWKYSEGSTGKILARSEGLGVASFHMFMSGVMSSDKKSLRADAQGLQRISADDLKKSFQVSAQNPLVGVEGRVGLLNSLGRAVQDSKHFRDGRPGNILDDLIKNHGQRVPAKAILRAVLDRFGGIWPGRLQSSGRDLGDVWMHTGLSRLGAFEALVPFHKLSQWLTYSLIEPIIEGGLTVTGVDELTGLAEYRNGGLMIDSGLISLRNSADLEKAWPPGSDLIIEWRALTVHLLDLIGAEVQKALGLDAKTFPLAKVLEGGTWWAGRKIAQEKRAGGPPPLNITSDGTVF